MIVDSSALLAMFYEEEDATSLLHRIQAASVRRISAVSFTEASVALLRARGAPSVAALHALLADLSIGVEDVTPGQAGIAIEAYRRFGKGFHAARLNLGDCFSYALAMHYREPLLFKGNDFNQTDVPIA